MGHSVEYMLAPRPMSSPIDQLDPQPPKRSGASACTTRRLNAWRSAAGGRGGAVSSAAAPRRTLGRPRPRAVCPRRRLLRSGPPREVRGARPTERLCFLDARSQAGQNGARLADLHGLRAAGTSRTPVALPRDAGGFSLPAFGRAALIVRFGSRSHLLVVLPVVAQMLENNIALHRTAPALISIVTGVSSLI